MIDTKVWSQHGWSPSLFSKTNLDNYDKKTFNVRAVNKGDEMIRSVKNTIRLSTQNQAHYTFSFWLLFHAWGRQWVDDTSLWKLSVWEICWQWFVSQVVHAPRATTQSPLRSLRPGPGPVSESTSSVREQLATSAHTPHPPRQHLVPCHAVSSKHHNKTNQWWGPSGLEQFLLNTFVHIIPILQFERLFK